MSPGSPHRVLLIEDYASLAEATAEFMRGEGLEVRIASTGKEALEMAVEFRPEIVLCDMMLPDMPGLEVAQILRRTPGIENALIAMHTAFGISDLGVPEQNAYGPVNMFFSKPLTPEKLDALISGLNASQRP